MVDDTNMGMIERVAQAVRKPVESDGEIYWAAEGGTPVPDKSLQDIARAAIQAMTEPTEAMLKAAMRGRDETMPPAVAKAVYQDMLKAALNE